ncbi:MAG: hypothetical protein IAX22_03720 [Candidatus Bathyarchaeota archaeon]|nr:hypothetical protein [Candidatus Bathyarchaeota archaeon]
MKSPHFLLLMCIVLVSSLVISTASGLEASDAAVMGHISTSSPKPGDAIFVTVTFQSYSDDPIRVLRVGVNGDWMGDQEFQGPNLMSNPVTVEAKGSYSTQFLIIVPSQVSVGSHNYIVGVDGSDQLGNTYSWESSQYTLQVGASHTNSPTPTPTEAPLENTSIELSCESSTSYSGFKVEIEGKLSHNSAPLQNQPILLSYSVTGGNTWQELTLIYTGSDGSFFADWRPTVTGNYLVKAVFEGTQEYTQTSEIVNLAVTSYQDENMFSVSSNSTITNLFFDSTSKELSFNVAGDSDTSGYANVYIAKNLVSDASLISVYLDGNKLEYSVIATEDSWILHFTYSHSSHDVTVKLVNSSFFGISMFGDWLIPIIAVILVVVVAIALAVAIKKRRAKNQLDLF